MATYHDLKNLKKLLLKTLDEWMEPTKKMNDVSYTADVSRTGVETNATEEESCCSPGTTANGELDCKADNQKVSP